MKRFMLLFILSSVVTISVFGKPQLITYREALAHASDLDSFLYQKNVQSYNKYLISSTTPVMTARGNDSPAINKINLQEIPNAVENTFEFRDAHGEETLTEPFAAKRDTKIPVTVYPQLLIFVERSLHVRLGGKYNDTLKYVVTFWNSVDKYFRNFTEPKIRLSLSGIVIGLDHSSTLTMLQIEKVKDYDGWSSGTVDIERVLDGSKKYFRKEARIKKPSYDIIAVMTAFNVRFTSNNADSDTEGLAGPSETCAYDSDEQEPGAVVFKDMGGFDGITTAVHELGHMLGAVHDDDADCTRGMKFGIMKPTAGFSHQDQLRWSPCSVQDISDAVRRAKCFHNVPDVDSRQMVIPMPGKLQSAEQQCQSIRKMGACRATENSCLYLSCKMPYTLGLFCQPLSNTPADGTACGDGQKHCFQGKCVEY